MSQIWNTLMLLNKKGIKATLAKNLIWLLQKQYFQLNTGRENKELHSHDIQWLTNKTFCYYEIVDSISLQITAHFQNI